MNRILAWIFPRWIPTNEQRRAALRRIRLAPLLMVLVLTGLSAHADELPSKPQPRTADKEFWIETAAMSTAWTLDGISTHYAHDRCLTCTEQGYFFRGTRAQMKPLIAWGLIDVGAAVLSYEWKRHVHNKYLHPLWRIPIGQRTFAHSEGAINNWRY